jgi:hypothetical protein
MSSGSPLRASRAPLSAARATPLRRALSRADGGGQVAQRDLVERARGETRQVQQQGTPQGPVRSLALGATRASPSTPGSKKASPSPRLLALGREVADVLSGRQARVAAALGSGGVKTVVDEAPEELLEAALSASAAAGAVAPLRRAPSLRTVELKQLYSLIRRKNGQLGGAGSGGAIYGEVTQDSFQRVVECLVELTGLGPESVFMDVGAGLGKPNMHVAVDPGVRLSLGVEIVGGRWWQSIHLLSGMLRGEGGVQVQAAAQRCFLAHADVCDLPSLDPVTHVYSFNKGFPPAAMRGLAKAFNRSHSARFLVCFDKLAKLQQHGFDLELLAHVNTKMEGSGEQNRCFVYRRKSVPSQQQQQQQQHVEERGRERERAEQRSAKSATPRTSPIKSSLRRAASSKAAAAVGRLDFDGSAKSDKGPRRAPRAARRARGPEVVDEREEEHGEVSESKAEDGSSSGQSKAEAEPRDDGRSTSTARPSRAEPGRLPAFALIAPPTAPELAPHVPHAESYAGGLAAMAAGVEAYLAWAHDQVGFERGQRLPRARRRAAAKNP